MLTSRHQLGIPRFLAERSQRIVVMTTFVFGVQLGDLALTWGLMFFGGMFEANPLVRALIAVNPLLVPIVKLSIMCFHAAVMCRFRTNRVAEIASWLGVIVMCVLCARWFTYLVAASQMGLFGAGGEIADPTWVSLG